MNKNTIRQKNILKRKSLDQKKASEIIVSKILMSDFFLNAKNVLIYYPLKYEISLLELLKAESKNFFLPKIKNDELEICPFKGELIKSSFNTLEPQTKAVNESIIDVSFVPAVGADRNLNRIGYGRGYYDRLFSNPAFRAKKVIVINKQLVVPCVFPDEFDKKADYIITD